MNFGEFKDGRPQQILPPSLSAYERDIANFEKLCHNLCIRLLRLFALGLKVNRSGVLDVCVENLTLFVDRPPGRWIRLVCFSSRPLEGKLRKRSPLAAREFLSFNDTGL